MTRNATEEISLQQLRALAAVAETGSFTLAAEAMQLTQPAISHLIKRMEEELGSRWWCAAGASA
jgi:DNA-binding transcriptional LysR family regulator